MEELVVLKYIPWIVVSLPVQKGRPLMWLWRSVLMRPVSQRLVTSGLEVASWRRSQPAKKRSRCSPFALSRPTSHIHRERTATVSIIHGPTAPCKQRQCVFISSLFHSVCLTFTHFYVWTLTPPPKKKQKNWISIRLTGHKCLNPVGDLLPQGRYILLLLQYMIKNIEYIPLLSK